MTWETWRPYFPHEIPSIIRDSRIKAKYQIDDVTENIVESDCKKTIAFDCIGLGEGACEWLLKRAICHLIHGENLDETR
jgi:hypothetical protein